MKIDLKVDGANPSRGINAKENIDEEGEQASHFDRHTLILGWDWVENATSWFTVTAQWNVRVEAGAFLLRWKRMKWTKNWGTVSGNAELYMLNHAEHTRKKMAKKNPAGQRLPACKVHKNE